jgi:pimeloyl-ACP methyl ester carboxylesterase
MTDLRHEQVTVDGMSIHAVTVGPIDAPALLLLHGWPESWVTWRELIPLAARSHRVVAIDLPGIGGSSGGGAPGAKAGIARLVHGLAVALNLTDVTLVGHDIGGMVTYAYLREFTDLARAVIMDVPIPGVDPWDDFVRAPFLWHFALHAVPRLPELLVTGREPEYLGYFYDLLSATPGAPAAQARQEQVGAYETPDALTAGFGWYRAFAEDVRTNREGASGGPTATPLLYLRGGAERGGPIGAYTDGLRRAGVTDVRPAVIDRAGHFPQAEDPAATWRAISGFIADSPAGAPVASLPVNGTQVGHRDRGPGERPRPRWRSVLPDRTLSHGTRLNAWAGVPLQVYCSS